MKLFRCRQALPLFLCLFSFPLQAAPITFDFIFQDGSTAARATGSITIEETLINNPGTNSFVLPGPEISALSVTVTGSAMGNGSFAMADFSAVNFDTGALGLDFETQLVGQPTGSGPWGGPGPSKMDTKGTGPAGGFQLFENVATKGGLPPDSVDDFVIGANGGGGETMELVSMIARGSAGAISVPVMSPLWMALLAACLFVLAIRRLKSKA